MKTELAVKRYSLTFLFLNFCFLSIFSQWVQQISPTTQQMSGISFPTTQTGYIGGTGGEMYKTTDAAASWTGMNSGTTANIFSMHFTNELTGFACAGDGTGSILKTVDGGENWTAEEFTVSSYLLDITFINDSVGLCVGYSGTILRTTDQGVNWSTVESGTGQNLRSIHFPSESIGYTVTEYNGVLKSSDGGLTWTTTGETGISEILLDIFFTDDETGFAVGGDGKIIRTTDGADTWVTLESGTTHFIQEVHFTDSSHGYAVGGYGIVHSTSDGGDTWISEIVGEFTNQYGWYGITFTEEAGYLVGYLGRIAKTGSVDDIAEFETTEKLHLFPNPSSGKVTWKLDCTGAQSVVILNDRFQVVFETKDIDDSSLDIDLPSGVYTFNLVCDKSLYQSQLLMLRE